MDDMTKQFLTYDYGETKDLAEHFLTLIVAVLVFSLTFSEKIIQFPKANRHVRIATLTSWSLFLLAIVASGIALVLISQAAAAELYGAAPFTLKNAEELEYRSINALLVGGVSFVVGLALLIVAALLSTFNKEPRTAAQSEIPRSDVRSRPEADETTRAKG
jgi:hypothetical protein